MAHQINVPIHQTNITTMSHSCYGIYKNMMNDMDLRKYKNIFPLELESMANIQAQEIDEFYELQTLYNAYSSLLFGNINRLKLLASSKMIGDHIALINKYIIKMYNMFSSELINAETSIRHIIMIEAQHKIGNMFGELFYMKYDASLYNIHQEDNKIDMSKYVKKYNIMDEISEICDIGDDAIIKIGNNNINDVEHKIKNICNNASNINNDKIENIDRVTIQLEYDGVAIDKVNKLVCDYDYEANKIHLDKLYDYQKKHFVVLERTLLKNGLIMDASDTGTGKTYVILALAKKHNLIPFVICSKSMIKTWFNVAETIGINLYGVSNYECFARGNYYDIDMNKQNCPFIKKEDKRYNINFPSNYIIIYDEAHKCKQSGSINSKIMREMKIHRHKIALLSATIIDKVEHFKPFGHMFNFYNHIENYARWINYEFSRAIIPKEYIDKIDKDKLKLLIINHKLFPEFGGRMKLSEIGDNIKENQVMASSYFCEKYDAINDEYTNIKVALSTKNKSALAEITKARQNIETFKLPIIIDLIETAIESNYSVVVFVNFIKSVDMLCNKFNTKCKIIGEQHTHERMKNIQDFQNNTERLIICTIQSGACGISLHDVHGDHPRISIISPSYSGTELMQTLGRIHRAGSKSHAIQKIVYCAKTCEESVAKIVSDKVNNIKTLNDGDLLPNVIDSEHKTFVIELVK